MNFFVKSEWAAAGEQSAAIRISGLRKSFQPGKVVLDGIDLSFSRGRITALIGANGAGKSTLLRCIPRLVAADAGRIEVLGENILEHSGRSLRDLRTRIGFVFQKHNLVSRLSALSNVIQGAQARGFGPRAWCQSFAPHGLRKEAMACLDRVGLAGIAGQRADSLSGGQSQRVAIARVLMQKPDIVLADEPAASLDPQAGDDVMHLLFSLMRDEALTVVFTSHHLAHALNFSDRVVGLSAGRAVIDAPSAGLGRQDLVHLYA
jgi:phosphonate transport system ATP-binding protein